MNIKSFFLGNKETRVIKKAESIIKQLEVTTPALVKNDIAAWRMSHQMALNVENPNRVPLYNIYDFTTNIDTHLTGVVNRTKLGIMQQRLKVTDKNGKEDYELTKLFRTPWFVKFMSLALDAEYYGNSLIQLGNVIDDRIMGLMYFDGVELVDRRHVIPELGVIVREQGDDPKTGHPYRTGSITNWCIEAGEKDSLGLFLKVTPHVISKKHVQIFWDNFAERFGIPLIYAITQSRSAEDRVLIEDMLQRMGNSAWAFFPEGTELKLLETGKGDIFEVFDRRIIRANTEISIGLAGQTMAFEDGSSRSQAEVHEKGFEEIKASMAQNLLFLINFKLLPVMVRHGFPLSGYSVEWDNTYEYTPEEMRQIEQMLLNNYDIDPIYFVDKYNIPITGLKSQPDFFG